MATEAPTPATLDTYVHIKNASENTIKKKNKYYLSDDHFKWII